MYSRTSLDTTERENKAFGTASLICLKKRVIAVEFLASDFIRTRPKPMYLTFLNSGYVRLSQISGLGQTFVLPETKLALSHAFVPNK